MTSISKARDALGFSFATLGDPAAVSRLDSLFDGLELASPHADVTLVGDGAGSDLDLADLVSRVNIAAINAASGNLLLHAGAVARPDGQLAILAGASGSGKTTLTVRLSEMGLHYVTDEVVCLAPDSLRVSPYRKPVVLKRGAQHLFRHLEASAMTCREQKWLIAPQGFERTRRPKSPLAPALLIFPRFQAGVGCDVRALPTEQAAFLLGEHSSRLHAVAPGPLPALARVARRTKAFSIVHGDVDLAADAVTHLLDAA